MYVPKYVLKYLCTYVTRYLPNPLDTTSQAYIGIVSDQRALQRIRYEDRKLMACSEDGMHARWRWKADDG